MDESIVDYDRRIGHGIGCCRGSTNAIRSQLEPVHCLKNTDTPYGGRILRSDENSRLERS